MADANGKVTGSFRKSKGASPPAGEEAAKRRRPSDEEDAKEEEEEEEECCICLDDVSLRIKTPCSHTFCFLCIKGVVQQDVASRKKPVCPLCRAELDETFLAKARMRKSAYDEANEGSDIKFQWRYSGNKGGWWLYDDATNAGIEERYAEFLADSSKDSAPVDIGGRRYVISFAEMKQKNAADPRRQRRINRVPKSAILQADKGAAAKGQAGVQFAD